MYTEQEEWALKVLSLFKIDKVSAYEKTTPLQKQLFCDFLLQRYSRQAILAPTGYGKTQVIAMALVAATTLLNREYIVAAQKYGTSKLIMNMFTNHLFDNIVFYSELGGGTKNEQLKKTASKSQIDFIGGGSIKLVTLHGAEDDISQSIGEHAPNIVLDESPLISYTKYAQVIKILAGSSKTHMVELGNAVNDNHFRAHFETTDGVQATHITLDDAVREGRLSQEVINMAKDLPLFDEFYSCKFPERDIIDAQGYRPLVTHEELNMAFGEADHKGKKLIGADIAAGGDSNVYAMRSDAFATILGSNKSKDTMTNVVELPRLQKEQNALLFIDDLGIGHGVSDRMQELNVEFRRVKAGDSATDKTRYANKKAELAWRLRTWLIKGGKLDPKYKKEFEQILWIKYKITSDKLIAIEPKDELKKRTKGISPDFYDALACTFDDLPATTNVVFV